jgi:hypothetical protein
VATRVMDVLDLEAADREIEVPLVAPGDVELGQALAEEIGDEVRCSPDWTTSDHYQEVR